MEAKDYKKFLTTLKGFRTKYGKKPNLEQERKSVETLVEKYGGKLEAIASLNENGADEDLKEYVKKVLGLMTKADHEELEKEPAPKAIPTFTGEDGNLYARKNGYVYRIDTIKKTMTKVYKDFSQLAELDTSELPTDRIPLTTYQRYLRDHFPGEDCPIKKGKLHFRGFRIGWNDATGFSVEDTNDYYREMETPWEGIPTPKELGDFFKNPIKPKKREFTPEEEAVAIERGKEAEKNRKEEQKKREAAMYEEVDYEALRKKVLLTLHNIKAGDKVDPLTLPDMIPFKRWQRKVRSLITKWKKREIRYAKFIKLVEEATTEETFVVEEKKPKVNFKGTLLPDHDKVGMLVGDKIEVDGKMIDAVPFLLDYLLHYEPRPMAQIMRYANGEISDTELIENPMEKHPFIEYKKKSLANTAHNAQVLTLVYEQVGVVAPQDLLFEADLAVGDKIWLLVDGELRKRTISKTEKGIELGRGVGLLKLDKWIKINNN